MRSIAMALTWEFWVRGRFWFAAVILCVLSFCSLLRMPSHGVWAPDSVQWALHIYPPLLMWSAVLIIAVMVHAVNEPWLGFSPRLFTAPVSTTRMVVYKLTLTFLGAAFLYVAPVWLLNGGYGLTLPLAGPACFLGTLSVCVMAGYWSLRDFRPLKVVAWQALVCSLVFWLVVRFHPDGLRENAQLWSHVTWDQWLTMAAYTAAASVFAVVEVSRDRRGLFRDWPDVQQIYEWITHPMARRSDSFRSAMAAQMWAEFRPRGYAVPAVFGGLMALIVGIALGWSTYERGDLAGLLGALVLMIPLLGAFLNGLLFGHPGANGRMDLDTLTASRPLSDTEIAKAITRSSLRSSLLTWTLGIVAALVLLAGILWQIGPTGFSRVFEEAFPTNWKLQFLTFPVLSLIVVWTTNGLVGSLILTGRGRLIATVFVLVFSWPFANVVLSLLLVYLDISPNQLDWLIETSNRCFAWCLVIGALAGTIFMFFVALRRGCISSKTAAGAGVLWLIGFVVCASAFGEGPPHDILPILSLMALWALVIAPLPAAPLAIHVNRHR